MVEMEEQVPDPSHYLTSVEKLIREIDERNPKYTPANASTTYYSQTREQMAKSPVSIHQLKPIPKPKKKKKSLYR